MPIRIAEGRPEHWALRTAGFLVIAYFVLSPIFKDLKPVDYGRLTDIAVLALAALSLNLLIGFTGQISIGHSAFFGIGAYTTAILVSDHAWSPGWTFPVAALVCFAVGVLVGLPALRLKGLYLTLVTLALAQIFPALVRKFDDFTGGSQGIVGLSYDAPAWTGLDSGRQGRAEWLYWVALITLGLGYVLVRNLVKSRFGRSMVAVRDNTTAAAVMGVNVAFTKTVVFGLSASLAGIAGCTFAIRQTQATPANVNFTILGSILFLVIMVLGGTGSLLGPLVGAVAFYRIDEISRDTQDKTWIPGPVQEFLEGRIGLATLVFSTALIVLMFLAPTGLVGLAKRVGRRLVVVVPRIPSRPAPPGGSDGTVTVPADGAGTATSAT